MNSKILSMLLLFIVAVGFSGIASAADTIALTKMDPGKSTGNEGIADTNVADTEAICMDKQGTIGFNQKVTQTPGTDGVKNADAIKTAIVQNYIGMTPATGKDLQYVIWALSGDVTYKSLTASQKAMYDKAVNGQTPDHFELVYSEETNLVDTVVSEPVTVETGRVVNPATDVITQTGSSTSVTEVTENYVKTITTIVNDSFNNESTTITDVAYETTVTTTKYFETITKKLVFDFSNFMDGKKKVQDLLFFKVVDITSVNSFKEVTSDVTKSSEQIVDVINTPYDVITTTIVTEQLPVPVDPVVPVEPVVPVVNPVEPVEPVSPDTIPMQPTGGNFDALIASALAILAGFGIAVVLRRRHE